MAATAPAKADPVVQAHHADEGEGEEAAQHHQIALGEIDDLGGLVDEHEAERDQAIDAAERNTADQLLNEIQHRRASSSCNQRFFVTALSHLVSSRCAVIHRVSAVCPGANSA
jgi:hypothetical protein